MTGGEGPESGSLEVGQLHDSILGNQARAGGSCKDCKDQTWRDQMLGGMGVCVGVCVRARV